jgi:hypothetical protein
MQILLQAKEEKKFNSSTRKMNLNVRIIQIQIAAIECFEGEGFETAGVDLIE